MLNKKGVISGMPIYFLPALGFFLLVMIFFSMLFFVADIGYSTNLVITSETYQDSSTLITLIRHNVDFKENSLTIGELISIAYEDNKNKELLKEKLSFLISKIPKPENRDAYWNLDISIDNQEFMSIGDKTVLATNYLEQSINVPLKDKRTANVKLYLNCLGCTKEDIDKYA